MHRNSQKRYYWDYIYSVTCNTQNKFPFFKEKEFCDIFMNVLSNTKNLKKFELYAFCLNYDHFHILLRPDESVANISQIMQCLKKNVSININKKLWFNNILQCKRENAFALTENQETISFLQCRREIAFAPTEDGQNVFNKIKFQRQKSFHDHIIRNEWDFVQHLKYIQFNYLKHNIPENRKYTSHKNNNLIDYLNVNW